MACLEKQRAKLQNSQQLGTNGIAKGITEVIQEPTPSKTTYKIKNLRETS